MLVNGRTAMDGLSGSGSAFSLLSAVTGSALAAIDPHRPGDVLDLLLAPVLEGVRELVPHLLIDLA